MNNANPITNNGGLTNRGQLLRQQLAENEQKLALLNQEQALKMQELNRVQQKLDELDRQYPGYKHKK